MGAVGSHSEGEGEEEEEEEEEAAAIAVAAEDGEGGGGAGASVEGLPSGAMEGPSGAAGAPSPPPRPSSSSSSSLPPASVLLGQARLREEAAARLREAPSSPTTAAAASEGRHPHHPHPHGGGALVRWLEERLGRGERSVTVEQLREALESRGGGGGGGGGVATPGNGGTGSSSSTGSSSAAAAAGTGAGASGGAGGEAGAASEEQARNEEVLAQFDTDGVGTVDVENMLEALRASGGACLQRELSHVVRQLQACTLVPGFIDIFSESNKRLSLQASMILRFLHRHRIASTVTPYPVLEYFNNICTMRSSVLKDSLDQLLLKENDCTSNLNGNQEMDKIKSVSKCFTHIEASSNSADIYKMINGETFSFWQSDGSARSHWIRLKMKSDVILRHLSIAVAANDQSYMPQQVTVAVGKTASSLQEVRDVHIPSNVTGYVTLLENANISQMYVQINIKRCLSDGCDTRIHGIRAIGYQRVRKSAVSVCDASAIWCWSLLTSLITASVETNPAIVHAILQNTQKALQHMPPLSLSPGSTDVSSFLSPKVLEEVDSFLLEITSRYATPEVELTLLAFSLARGSITKVLNSLSAIAGHLETPYKAASLIASMATVRQNLLYKYATPLRLTLQACDVKGKEDQSGPENLLAEPWTGDGFLTETGKRRASVIFSTGTESALQVTQIRIKVRRGAIGARCGLVFAYSCPSEKFHAEEHFRRFESYDKWTLEDFRHYLKARSSLPRDELGEQDPVGWFELEEEWDEVEVRMQPCRISKYLMVKFLCTRQERAERLGVQGLSVLGYLRPPSVEPSSGNCCRACGKPEGDTVCGMTLLLKTLSFVQQLAQDMAQKKESGLRYKPYLDFSGLDLRLFWNFYSELHQNPREECVDARTVLLRLLQSCFPALASEGKATKPREAAESQAPVSHEAAEELYKHLCEVVDNGTESASLKTLKEEVNNTLLNGAAIFFPQRQSRREQLFAMLKNITKQEHKPSVQLAFKSLCTYFSDRDPGGLLLLPDRGTAAEFDVDQVLSVMETLLMVMRRECDMLMTGVAQQDTGSVLSSLFWSVQGSLLSWCYLQLNGSDAAAKSLAVEILTKYVRHFLANVQTALELLLIQHSSKTVVEKLSNSVLSMVARQLMTFLQDFAPLNIPHRTLLNDISQLTKLLNVLSADPGDGPNKVGFETWQQEQPVVLRTWTAESPHNYENNCHDVTVFLCPGASYFEVEFDERCETERRYDYLEFTDGKGAKTRYDTKVGTDKWPKKVTFKAGLRLQFLFHSDSSNNEWGYKFTVTAYGLPDVEVSWGLDLQLLVARLMGRLASQSLALKSPLEAGSDPELPPAKVAAVLNSPLWKPVFTHQTRSEEELSAPQPRQAHAEIKEAAASEADCHTFLLNFSKSDPARECCGPNSELFKGLVQACKKPAPKTDIVAGSTIDQAVQSTFAALVYLSPDLYGKLQTYVNSGGKTALSDEFAQVYSLADGIRIWMLEMKQKFLMDQSNDEEEKQAREMVEVNPETLAQQCIQKSLLLLSFLPARTKAEGQDADSPEDLRRSHQDKRQRTSSIVESDFQASDATPLCGATCLASPVAEPEPEPKRKQAPDSPQTEAPGGSHHKPLEGVLPEQEETTSPPSTPTRKPPFNRGRLRLLSFRSMEESRPAPSIKERYPILRHALDFIKDQSLSHESVLKVLALRKTQAKNILEVLKMILQCLESLGQPHCFVPPCIIFLLELLACQKDFANYFGHLEGCGATLHREIRESYYQLLRFLVKALKGFNSLNNNKSLLPALSCVQMSLLHLLDMGWEPSDLSFFVDMQLPQLLVAMSRENMGTYEATVCPRSEEEELADYKQNMEWMDECHEGVFESWCDKISQADPERQRKMHMFIARYRDLLHVDISCDGCDEIAPWHRYRCLQCNDMDLCKTCFLGGVRPEGHEASHDMVSMEHACSHCRGVIVGQRVSCLECEDFDLCFGCHSAKKFADSHPPDHRLAVRPLTTFRISEHHRLIQPYLHNYSWLLFSALALYSADLLSGGQDGGDPLDQLVVAHARTLQKEYVRIIGDCLMKVQRGTGLKSSALLTVMPEGQPSSRDVVPSVDSSTENGVQNSENEDPASNKMRPALFTQCNGGRSQAQASAAPKRKPRAKSASKASSGLPPRKKSGLPEGESRVAHSDVTTEDAEVSTRKEAEEKSVPSQEDLFAECFQKRVLGLLAAMLPHLKSGLSVSQIDLEQILPLLFRVVISNAGHLNDTYHFTLGLLGQLIRRLMPGQVDAAVSGVLPAEHSLVATGEASVAPEGWKTVHLLFSLGAVCLDSRVGLDWASTMADILRALGATEQWCPVVAAFTDHCIKQLPFHLKHTNIFTLLVLVGFPEVLCTGTRSVYVDHANEAHPVVILKHFAEKNRAVVVDVKTRKRKTVKDLQLIHPWGREDSDRPCQLRPYLQHFVSIATHLLQANPGSGCPEAVEATWVLSLALKGLYRTLKQTHAFEEISSAFLQTGLLKLLVKKCSKGTGFSKTWLLRDLEILSIMLYSSKKEISSLVEHKDTELHEGDPDQPTDSSAVSPTDADQSRMDPLEGLDETTKICFLMTHDALDAPLHILRAMYELQMKRRDSFFLEVQKRFDGDVVTTDERIRTLAQKWQPSKRLRPEEQSSKALDTDMIIVPCLAKPAACHRATEESNPVAQKLITGTESDLQLSYARQRRAKSAALLHKELAARSQKAARGYLSRVNEATAVLYARHVLAWLLATWPEGVPIGEDMLELSGPAHMAYILDTLLQLEEKPLCEKILLNVLRGCSETMLATVALTACQFMEEPGMAVQVRESKHPYNNNTNFEDKVHIPGAIYLSVKFDPQCNTEEGCDELLIASSGDFTHDRHTFSGPSHKWTDFELPGDTLHYRFTSDMSNTEWGYKFTVTAGHLGRFQTGFEILKQMLSEDRVVPHLPLEKVWAWQVGVACRQTGHQRLKAIHLLLRIVQCRSERGFDLTLLKPLWHLFSCMENNLCQDDTKPGVLLPLHRALTELFFVTEGKVGELGCLQEYLLALNTEDHLHRCTAQALKNIAAISLAINYPNKSTTPWSL